MKLIISEYIKGNEISGICISTAGMVDPIKGKIVHASDLIPNYTGTEIKNTLEKEFNLRCEVENDVNCAGLGELWRGAGVGVTSCICITVGTGIGGCIIIDNKVLHGFSNSAGEIGYMNINNSTFQEIASTRVLVKNVAVRKGINCDDINGKEIFDLAKNGDKDCIEEIDSLIDALTLGISNMVYIINPEVVILGGGIMAQKVYLKEKIEKSLKNKLIERVYKSTKLKFAENENSAGMIGALYNFLNR